MFTKDGCLIFYPAPFDINQLRDMRIRVFQSSKIDKSDKDIQNWGPFIMSNRPVRDQWEYPRKMEQDFPIKVLANH